MEALCLSRLRDKGLGARSPLSLCLFLQSSTGDTRKKPIDLKISAVIAHRHKPRTLIESLMVL
jgi:hypothetical protein